MARKNNKGFSLIEIVIAVAILSILLTPIIKQFASSMETSRRAKALQEANETAVREVEEFQSYSKEELDTKYSGKCEEIKKTAQLVDTDGNPLTTGSTPTVDYTVYKYTLDDSKIGAKNDVYRNVVQLDDLSNKVRAYGGEGAPKHYKIAYNMTDAALAAAPDDKLRDYVITNEGAAVKYDDEGFISSIVCTDKNANTTPVSYMQNPNEVNLGNMHDLDKNSVALVLGGTSSYDSEAYSALFSKAMDHLRDADRDSWEQALLNVDNESILASQESTNTNRLIKISIDKKKEAVAATTEKDSTEEGETTEAAEKKERDVYYVKVDVYYHYKYTIKGMNGNVKVDGGTSDRIFEDVISYTVFSQKFYTKEPPEIYFEYQPYCISGNSADVKYKADDYILFDNHVDEAKLYLYKPYKDQMNSGALDKDYDDAKSEGFAYYTDSSEDERVRIHLASTTANNEITYDKNNVRDDTENSTKRIYVFTNLDIGGYEAGTDTYKKTETSPSTPSQFVSDSFPGVFQFDAGTQQDIISQIGKREPLGNSYKVSTTKDNITYTTTASKVLYTLSEDTREAERLYTVTVTLTPTSDALNTVHLSGAKGAN